MKNLLLSLYKATFNLSDEDLEELQSIKSLENYQNDPKLLTGCEELVDKLYENKDKKFTIHSDYDVDGVCAGIILKASMLELGIGKKVNLFYPNSHDGYGMTIKSVDKILENFETDIIITADNGIKAYDGIEYAYKNGLRVFVTDHHTSTEVDKLLSTTFAEVIVNPNYSHHDEKYPFKDICGTTVAWKVLYRYTQKYCPAKLKDIERLLILVGIATIADVMPLVDENRWFVKHLLNVFDINTFNDFIIDIVQSDDYCDEYKAVFRGLFVMFEPYKNILDNNYYRSTLNTNDFGWQLVPLLNAPRRILGSSEIAYQLFEQKDMDSAFRIYNALNIINKTRKGQKESVIKELGEKINNQVVFIPDCEHGLLGLIAGDICNLIGKPTIVFAKSVTEPDKLVSSARSPENYNLLKLLQSIPQRLLYKYGGHPQAAGVTIFEEDYLEFKEYFENLTEDAKIPNFKRSIRKNLDLSLLNLYDASNVDLVFLMKDLKKITNCEPFDKEIIPEPYCKINYKRDGFERTSLSDGKHLKLSFLNNNMSIFIWNISKYQKDLINNYDNLDFYGNLSINRYEDNYTMQFFVDKIEVPINVSN